MDYNRIPPERLGEGARLPILKLGDPGEVYYELAMEMVEEILRANRENRRAVFICPVGPVGQYPIFVRLVNRDKISLKNCWFINMDEYLTDSLRWIDERDPLSFRGFMNREVYGKISPELVMPPTQRVFPDPLAPEAVGKLIKELGGVTMAVGGVGLNGHLAFNEPQPELTPEAFAALPCRVLEIAPETRAVNAAGSLGGALERMPAHCVTLGMADILGAAKLRLGCFREWHRGVVRRAAYGAVSAAFPATLAQTHRDALLYVTADAAKLPYD